MTIHRTWDKLTEDERKKAIDAIIGHFLSERDEEMGVIAAGELLDFFEREVGTMIYRAGVRDARKLLKEKVESLDVDLSVLAEQ